MIKSKSAKALTLVEVMVTLAVIAILSLVVWQLFYTGHKTFDEGIWRNEREQEVKIGFRTMQEDVKNLANLSGTWGTKMSYHKAGKFDFIYNSSALSEDGVKPGHFLMKFYSCRQPLRAGAGSQNKPAKIDKVIYEIDENRELKYSKWQGEISPDNFKNESSIDKIENFNPESAGLQPVVTDKTLVHDVDSIILKPFGKDSELKKGKPVIIVLKLTHITRRKKPLKPLLKEALFNMNVEPRKE